MLSLDDFKEVISFIKDQQERQNKFCDVLEELSPGNYCNCFLYSDYETMLVKIITIALGIIDDESKVDTLMWWLYDCEFGENVSEFYIDGKAYLLNSVEKLYEYLLN